MECFLFRVVGGDSDSFVCGEKKNGYIQFAVDLPSSFVDAHRDDIDQGGYQLTATQVTRDVASFPPQLQLYPDSVLSLSTNIFGGREDPLSRYQGRRSMLMIRVTTSDPSGNVPSKSAVEISSACFGADNSIQDLTHKCSNGRLDLGPATHIAIVNGGVLDITIEAVGDSATHGSHDKIIYNKVQQVLGDHPGNLFDYFATCLPDRFNFNGAAGFGTLGGQQSWYPAWACTSIGIIGHELGHNYGLAHSRDADGTSEYGDGVSCGMHWSKHQLTISF